MKREMLLFSGTTEGRLLSEKLAVCGIAHQVYVATEYGEAVMQDHPLVTIHTGRIDRREMENLFRKAACFVYDATHPYATDVSRNLQAAANTTGTPYLRVLREEDIAAGEGAGAEEEDVCFSSVEACASALLKTEGKILLTTGSKDLAVFTKEASLRERLIVRVLPTEESLHLCAQAGLSGKQIIAMQGPFSTAMNRALIQEKQIAILVTKESGETGGFPEKLEAARAEGIQFVSIRRPEESGLPIKVALEQIEAGTLPGLQESEGESVEEGAKTEDRPMQIALVGTGPGAKALLTKETEQTIREADILFGAERMLEPWPEKISYPYYRAVDILPMLETQRPAKAAILFSGDIGLYSGAEKMEEALRDWASRQAFPVQICCLPGLSSVAYLSAKTGVPYADTTLCSLHGQTGNRDAVEAVWNRIAQQEHTFVLLSGVADVQLLGKWLCEQKEETYRVTLGYRLSYPEERIEELTPEACLNVQQEGLYLALVQRERKED